MPIIAASELRTPAGLAQVPDKQPGWYRWWAPDNVVQKLLGNHYQALSPHLTAGQGQLAGLYCMYVGVAVKESIRARLNWHVNQHHTLSCVRSGTLSTLRQSIASLVGLNQLDEVATNTLINQLTVEYFYSDYPIRSPQAKAQLEQFETHEMEAHNLPLNIKCNRSATVQEFKQFLKTARKTAKQKGF